MKEPLNTSAGIRRRTLQLLAVLVPAMALSTYLVLSARRNPWQNEVARRAIPALVSAEGRTWSSVDMKLSELEMTILETRDYLMRTYSDGQGSSVDLCIIFSEDNRKGTHPPEVCLEGGGSRIVSKQDRVLDLGSGERIAVRELVIKMGNVPMYFSYFYKCGESITPSFYRQQALIIWNGLVRHNSAGALVRYSSRMDSVNDVEAARRRTDQLIRATYPYIRTRLGAG